MKLASMTACLAALALAGGLSGCATTLEMGPGYYHYDTRAVSSVVPAPAPSEPVVVYREPAVRRY